VELFSFHTQNNYLNFSGEKGENVCAAVLQNLLLDVRVLWVDAMAIELL